jgi:type IV pilus assembly protein PilA
MRSIGCVLAGMMLWGTGSAQEGPQTARQALLEMFFSKTPGTLVKHLPAATLAALEKSGVIASLQQYSLLASQMQTQGQNFQTFETGSVLLSGENPKTGQKVEVTVENDALRGDEDDLELSFQTYKDGQVQRTPFMPRMTFSMKQEARVWKLNEISVTVRLPLADHDLLKAFSEGLKARQNASISTTPQSPTAASPAGSDAQVLAAMRTIVTAEITYATTYPQIGYTCTLSNLDGFGGGEPNEHQAMLINSGLASGKRYGFVFSLSGCAGAPATGFHLSATPNANTFGRKAFCADQSGVIRASESGDAARCFANGTGVQ